MPIVRRSQEPGGSSSSGVASARQEGYWGGLPDLCEFLASSVWPDGKSRITGTMMLMHEGGRWKCWLHDRDAAMGCFLSGLTIEEALLAAEGAVGTAGADWRADKRSPAKRG